MEYFYFIVLYISGHTCAFDVYDFNMVQFRQGGRNFSFRSCDKRDSYVHITELKIVPHPITFGELLLLSFSLNLTQDIGKGPGGIEVDLMLEMKTPTEYVSLCDFVGKDYCYWNMCERLQKLEDHCPPELAKLTDNCRCPMQAGVYNNITVPVILHRLPFYLRATLDITFKIKEEGKEIGCVEVHLCVNECMFV